MAGYDAVLFDNDGVLVEPPVAATQREATRDAFEAVGVEDVRGTHLDAIVGGVTHETFGDICRSYDVDPDVLWTARERHDERSQLAAFRAGDRDRYDDVAAIETLSPACGVVSNNHHSTVEFVLEFFDLDHLFDTYHGREKTVESLRLKKPAPHYLERALAELGAESALYVGDSESDLVAASRAGIDSAFVRRAHRRDLVPSVEPTYEVRDLHEVRQIVEG